MGKPGEQQLASQVRVGLRVRPLTSQELREGGKNVLNANHPEVCLGERRFTFDSVFDANVDQQDLYRSVSAPLLQTFLEGYNATIMAYGQTGSGKTFTMGSEAHTELQLSDKTGLIPRFMNDLFRSLDRNGENCRFSLKASFLEVYGEDVHDLLDPARPSLPLREDSNGGVICSGLTCRSVSTAEQALAVLHEGTLNRTTAATLMNLTSSRSHAVFSVDLTQKQCSEGVDVTTVSRFTFVDLAGSERMKRTGAEGERAREGIKINEGLLALGNVINALADESRLAEGKKVHVPYRQSKLTRLLQDALGGNSQTLFLACVSPSDTNASETLSTLHYANRARNIKNAPTKNVDANLLELMRLRSLVHVLEKEAIKHKFGGAGENPTNIGQIDETMLQREDVVLYLERVRTEAEKRKQFETSPSSILMQRPSTQMIPASQTENGSPHRMIESSPNKSIIDNFNPSLLSELNPDEEMAILDQLLDLQSRDQEFSKEHQKDDEEIKLVEGELAEQEALLLQLRESLKIYHDMKAKYEALMTEVRQLESEKAQLAELLENAAADPSKGCSKSIKKELERVEKHLARARNETREHREKYRRAEQEAKKCAVLERKVEELKAGRVKLIKKQKEAAARHRDYTEAKTREILALKRKERNNEKRVSKMQAELQMQRKNLAKRQEILNKLSAKSKQTEAHLMKLLSMRRRVYKRRGSNLGNMSRSSIVQESVTAGGSALSSEMVDSVNHLLDQIVNEEVVASETKTKYEESVRIYGDCMRKLVAAVKELEESKRSPDPVTISDIEQTIEDLELKVDLVAHEMETLGAEVSVNEKRSASHSAEEIVNDKEAPLLRRVLLEKLRDIVSAKIGQYQVESALKLSENVRRGLEDEVEALSSKVTSLTKDLQQSRSARSSETELQKTIDQLQSEIQGLSSKLSDANVEKQGLSKKMADLSKKNKELETQFCEAREMLALQTTASANNERFHDIARGVLDKIHHIWRELGVPVESRDNVRRDLENCLDDTCQRKLDEALAMKKLTEENIKKLKDGIVDMNLRLGMTTNSPGIDQKDTLIEYLRYLERIHSDIEPVFLRATKRADGIAKHVKDICYAMSLPHEELASDLQVLATSKASAGDLSDEFLSRCDQELSALRVRKSQTLARNADLLKETFGYVSDMNLGEEQIIPLVQQSLKKRSKPLPGWWDSESAGTIARAASTPGGVVRVCRDFYDHLLVIRDGLASVAKSRSCLSRTLRELVERAQKTLLSTLEDEAGLTAVSAGFSDALFRLPHLSKEFVDTCIAEVDALVAGVDAMTQSESEALAVVWDALAVSIDERGRFWGSLDDALSEMRRNPSCPLDEVIHTCAVDSEEWVLGIVESASQSYRSLDCHLVKLERIHGEVEKLRARQDSKSKIISLDSEVRILSSQQAEFEEKKCSKQRLLTKKTGSSNLLKEERFRKQMQQKFTAKLEQLASHLKEWNEREGIPFDRSLLSEEVCLLLTNSDQMDDWVEKRTEFMHLRTVKTSTRAPVSKEQSDTRPPRQRLTTRPIASVNGQRSQVDRKPKRKVPPPTAPSNVPVSKQSRRIPNEAGSRKRKIPVDSESGRKRRVTQPFGHLLEEEAAPPKDENTDNL